MISKKFEISYPYFNFKKVNQKSELKFNILVLKSQGFTRIQSKSTLFSSDWIQQNDSSFTIWMAVSSCGLGAQGIGDKWYVINIQLTQIILGYITCTLNIKVQVHEVHWGNFWISELLQYSQEF